MLFHRLLLPKKTNYLIINRFKSSTKLDEIPKVLGNLLFSNTHEWVKVNGDVGTVGISDYAQKALGDVVYAQLPDVGLSLDRDENCGALESVKAASEIYCPVSGTIVEKNKEVEDNPSFINKSCYDKGWLFKIQIQNKGEINDLMNADKYEQFLKSDAVKST